MPDTMKAAIYAGPGKVKNIVRDIPEPDHGEALIRIESVGICGTDIAIFSGKHPRAKAPLIMGHEVGAVVAGIAGEKPAGIDTGTRVTFFPLINCGVCATCKSGKTYVCEKLGLIGIDSDGGMAEFAVVPSEALIPVPQNWDKRWAALMEPVAVAVHSVRRSSIMPGDKVLVTGAGIIGNLCAQMAAAAGATHVVIADINPYRLEIAKGLGMRTVDLTKEDINAVTSEVTGGTGFDVTMECSGSAPAQKTVTDCTRVLGEIIIVGMPKEPPPVDLRMVTFKELTLVGTRVYERVDFERSIELVAQGRVKVDNLISHEFPIEKVSEAFELMMKGAESLKILLTF